MITPVINKECTSKLIYGKKLAVLLFSMLTILVFISSCAPMSKESYMKKYGVFITEISQKYKTYDNKEWNNKNEKYQKFSGEWYEKFKDDFTVKEKITLTSYQVKFNYYRTLTQSSNAIKELFDAMKVDEIKEQIQYYIDNNMQDDLQKFYDEARKAGKEIESTVSDILEDLEVNIEELKSNKDDK
jgi:hypothetical protein